MHTFSETGPGVPAFLAKLWRLVEDPETNDLISWSTDGRSFIIQNQAQFAKELLPLNYKHNNMASFIRQLNMYGFHKITSIDNGGLRFDKDEMEFTHACFQKDHPYLLEHIKRKIATSKQQQDDKSGLRVEAVNRVLSEMKQMRGRQETLDTRFNSMKQENEALWREIAILRQKHMKQQQIVNKLIQFLVTIVQPSRTGLGPMGNGKNKRQFQLMLNDSPQSKIKKNDVNEGATIQELGEVLEEVAYENEQEMMSQDNNKKEKRTSHTNVKKERLQNSNNVTRSSEIPEVTSPSSLNHQSPYRPESVNEMIEEVISPVHFEAMVKQEKLDPSANTTRFIIGAENGEGQDTGNNYDDEEYLVDHVDELDPCNVEFENDTDLLNTPMVIKEMQKQQQLEQQKQQQANHMSQRQKPVNKGESLLRTKKSEIPHKTQNSLLTNSNRTQSTVVSGGNVPHKVGRKSTLPIKQIITTDDMNIKAGPSGMNSFATNASEPPSATIGFEVGDFTASEVPSDIFEDNNQQQKESPMLGAFNFEGGFYNPNVNITEMKARQQQSKQQSQQLLQNASLVEPDENSVEVEHGCLEDDDESGNVGNALAKFSNNELDLTKLSTLSDFDQHIDTVEHELQSLRDLLKGDNYQFDTNTLIGTASGNTQHIGRVFFSPSTFDADTFTKLFSGNEDIMGYDFPMNLPEATVVQRKPSSDSAITASNSTGLSSTEDAGGPSNQLITYQTTPGNGVSGDCLDLNELLNFETTNDDETSTVI